MCAFKKFFFTVHFMDMRKVLCYVDFLFIANMWFATFIKMGGMQQGKSHREESELSLQTHVHTHMHKHTL